MNTDPDVAAVAALIAVPARATILIALMDGRALPAGELARCAALSPQAASAHLNKLVAGGFLLMVSTGRHRYYRLASTEVAQVIEALMPLATVTARQTPHHAESKPIQVARSCYDHLAGQLGVAFTQALVAGGYLTETENDFTVTDHGADWFRKLGIDPVPAPRSRRVFARKCLDWRAALSFGWCARRGSTHAVFGLGLGSAGSSRPRPARHPHRAGGVAASPQDFRAMSKIPVVSTNTPPKAQNPSI